MFVPNFKIIGKAVPEKFLTENFHFNYIGVRDRKTENRKRRQNKSQHLGFVYSNTLGCIHCVYKIARL